MSFTIPEWHQRYLQQARWTQNMRAYLYQKVGLKQASKILDIGCGTGALEHELVNYTPAHSFALDIDPAPLNYARHYAPQCFYTLGDCLSLPYANRSIDVTFCHFLLLWVKDVHQALSEMVRVTRSNGYILSLAEPDYGGRIDFPPELSKIGAWQSEALKDQGANPYIGRELRSIFHHAGLVDVDVGVIGGQWRDDSSDHDEALEWEVIRSDLRHNNEFISQSDYLDALDLASRQNGQRVLFVPTFYAVGMVNG
jgi:ubiquinone/menaquinone biosynthesis C-methylase UbiE